MNIFLLYLTFKNRGNWEKILEDLNKPSKITQDNLQKLQTKVQEIEFQNYITILDKSYPIEFKNVYKPPFCIFYSGNLELLDHKNKICLSGNYLTKNIEDLIEFTTKKLFEKNPDTVLVTTAKNILEMKIVLNFLKNKQKIIFISSFNIQSIFSSFPELRNFENNFLIISEYYDSKMNLLNKQISSYRLLAAVSEKLILYSLYKSKTFSNKIDLFLEQGKEIFAFPNVDNDQNNVINNLIDEGAKIATSLI
ncbi:DNA-processing protein DprA [Mycoplasma zalophi]|uniref:DNA-processing protein DprA n=1 Tax=Mycoplasma zalophi TaxID=191287 RepID=UPI0021C9058B|nr:DNA-processing protein DprA [Mycoplasma zalophi]MCU4116891.1 DNA-processing protein DprA [Mycoplasma zalophi]